VPTSIPESKLGPTWSQPDSGSKIDAQRTSVARVLYTLWEKVIFGIFPNMITDSGRGDLVTMSVLFHCISDYDLFVTAQLRGMFQRVEKLKITYLRQLLK
jgi:hypothetical protein